MNIKKLFSQENKLALFLPLLLLISSLLRLPSLFEPYWYGDEGIYQVVGQVLASGKILYLQVWENKPPLLYIIYMFFQGDQFSVRLLSLLFMILTIGVFYKVSNLIFKSTKAVYVATSLFALFFATPFLEGNIANAENFMLLPILLSVFLVLKRDGKNKHYDFVAGLLLGVAFLLKSVAVFDLGALLTFLFIVSLPKKKLIPTVKNIQSWFFDTFFLLFGFTIPVIISFIIFFLNGGLSDYIAAAFAQNVTYVGKGNTLLGRQGLLFLKLFFLGCFSLFFLIKRSLFDKKYLFVYIWFAFSVFNAFFGGRPWIHYLLTLLPAFCLLIGITIEDKKLRLKNIFLCIVLLILLYNNFWVYGKTIAYYKNFVDYKLGRIDSKAYNNFFEWYVNRDYAVGMYIQNNSAASDKIFVWSDNAQIYVLSKRLPVWRYTVAYHMTFYPHALSETKEAILREKPAFIISARNDFPQELLDASYVFDRSIDDVKIFKRTTL